MDLICKVTNYKRLNNILNQKKQKVANYLLKV